MSPFSIPDWVTNFTPPPAPRNRHERRRNAAINRRHARALRGLRDRVVARSIVRWGQAMQASYGGAS